MSITDRYTVTGQRILRPEEAEEQRKADSRAVLKYYKEYISD